jgi:hypothetical protein
LNQLMFKHAVHHSNCSGRSCTECSRQFAFVELPLKLTEQHVLPPNLINRSPW